MAIHSFWTNHPIFPSTMGKLDRLQLKRAAAKKKAKADADGAAAADATTAIAAAIAAADTAVAPAAPSGYGIGTRRTYAAADADGTAVTVVTTSVNTAAVASLSSAVTRSSMKPKLSAAAVIPAVIADCTGDASPSVVTKSSKKPKLSATVVVLASRYPSRGNVGRNTPTAVGVSTDPVAKKDADTNLSAKKKAATAEKDDEL